MGGFEVLRQVKKANDDAEDDAWEEMIEERRETLPAKLWRALPDSPPA